MKGTIVGIGGGILRIGETIPIDQFILRLSRPKGKKVKVLFIPAASGDLPAYCTAFLKTYRELGALPRVLRLVKNPPTKKKIQEAIKQSDIVYLGGGDLKMLRKIWNKYGLGPLMQTAAASGSVMAGLSAGLGIWFEQVIVADRSGRVSLDRGIGLISGTAFPHYQEGIKLPNEYRKQPIIAVPDNCAVVFRDGVLEGYVSTSGASAYRIPARRGGRKQLKKYGPR